MKQNIEKKKNYSNESYLIKLRTLAKVSIGLSCFAILLLRGENTENALMSLT